MLKTGGFIFLMALIFLAGCVENVKNYTNETADGKQPYFTIKSPAEGQVITDSSVTVSLAVSDIILVGPTGDATPGIGHFHIFLDGVREIEGPQTFFTYDNLTAGRHMIRIELRRGDHSQFDPPMMKSVSFTIA